MQEFINEDEVGSQDFPSLNHLKEGSVGGRRESTNGIEVDKKPRKE